MTTKKKSSSGDPRSKRATGGATSAQDSRGHEVWERLQELASEFTQAADRERSRELLNLGFVLRTLCENPEFRKTANREARKHHSATAAGFPEWLRSEFKHTKRSEAQQLLGWVEPAINEYPEEPSTIAYLLVTDLSRHRQLVYRVPRAPTAADPHDTFVAAVERVTEAIKAKLADPDKDAKDVVRAAMRALDADPEWVRNLFPSERPGSAK